MVFDNLTEYFVRLSLYTRRTLSVPKVSYQLCNYPFDIKAQLKNIKEQKLVGNTITALDLNLKFEINQDAQKKFDMKLSEIRNQFL